MKTTLHEHDGCFGIDLEAETMADAALLTRFALNATKEVRSLDVTAFRDGTFTGYIVFGKRRRERGDIKS